MPIEFSEDVFQNDNFSATTDNSGNLVLEHKQTGGKFKFDATKNRWIPVQGVDLEGSDVDNVGKMDATDVTTDSVNSTSVTTDDVTVNNLLSAENADVAALEADKVATGLTWQTVTSSRSLDTTETNTSGSDIVVDVTVEPDADGTRVGIRFSDPELDIQRFDRILDLGDAVSISATIPNGADYTIQNFGDSGVSVRSWLELRP